MKIKYYWKLPRQPFAVKGKHWLADPKKMAKRIENMFAPGTTQEPYIQLVQETTQGWKVVAEWMPSRQGWVGALEAAGLVSHPV